MKLKRFFPRTAHNQGVSMTEVLVVVAVLALIMVGVLFFMRNNVEQARDARRKFDLNEIKTAFEDYHNDHGCYPQPGILEECKGAALQPYLNSIPCDPVNGEPYLYVPLPNRCDGYRVFSGLENQADPIIEELSCDGPIGCGAGPEYPYGISAGVPVNSTTLLVQPSGSPTPGGSSPSPSPSIIYFFACDASGVCNRFEENHPYLASCPVTFVQSNCNNACAPLANRCH